MAIVLTDAGIFIGGHDVSCDANQVTFGVFTTELNSTTFCSKGWQQRVAGLKTASLTGAALLSQGPDEIDPHFWDLLGTSTVPVSLTATDPEVEGAVAYLFQWLQTTLSQGGQVGALSILNFGGSRGSTVMPVVKGQVLGARGERTSSGNSTGLQLGALSASQTLWVALHVWSVSGTNPTLDVDVESDDNSDFTSAVTADSFTQATGSTSQVISIPGAETDDWWRVAWTIGGTDTPTFNFVIAAGIT